MSASQHPEKLLIVTGLSGAGMSSALKSLEDFGYEVLDNFPIPLLDPLLDQEETEGRRIAVGIDSRTRGFSPVALIDTVDRRGAELLFMTCDDAVLQKRFTETRRKHPMAKDKPVKDGIRLEHTLLEPVQARAHLVIDTSGLSIHDLRRMMEGYYGSPEGRLTTTIMSFGYRNGLPREADIVMDVRFLRNPHWDPKLKPLTGKQKKVGAYIEEDENFAPFIENLKKTLAVALPRYAHEGKTYLTIAIGCTGGKHRSVYVAERLAEWLEHRKLPVHIVHRDMPA
ncbi:MAG: RNase adapter RapZ [Alphaproteobacteria bacterium]|nr:RNase adapter RapZ [Alphaproteobacteria bacterium]